MYQLIEVDCTFRVLVTFDRVDFDQLASTSVSTLQDALGRAGGPAGQLALLAMLAKEMERGPAVRAPMTSFALPRLMPALEAAVNKNMDDSMAQARALTEEIRAAMADKAGQARNIATGKPYQRPDPKPKPKPKTPGSFPDLDFEEPK